ncbi:MAG: hypothetical protein JXN59_17900 [Anaerolineae bacterium]|nr:hypothetical protein [Anaerolineae bacterium]
MQKSRRATTIWLIMIGLMLGLAAFSGAISSQVAVIGLGAYLLMALIGLGAFNTRALRAALAQRQQARQARPRRQAVRIQTSSAAQKARQRASNLADYDESFTLADIGLIVSEITPNGLNIRRGDVTLDDQGIQPYAVIHADAGWTDQTVTALFEILDQTGEILFRHAEEVYLREGQNNLLSSHRLPLGDKAPEDANPGLWELRVSVAGQVTGLHTFAVGPSMTQRQRLMSDMNQRRARLRDSDTPAPGDDSPISLEDLLRGQG